MMKALTTRSEALLLCTVILLCAVLCGCKNEVADPDADIISAFTALYERAKVLNEAIYGKGLPAEDTEEASKTYSAAHYCTVSDDCPFRSCAELSSEIDGTFSKAYASSIKEVMFGGMEYDPDTEQIKGFQPRYKDINGVLAVNVMYEGFEISSHIDAFSAEVTEKDAVSCTLKAKYGDGGEEISIKMLKENGVWLLDSATY